MATLSAVDAETFEEFYDCLDTLFDYRFNLLISRAGRLTTTERDTLTLTVRVLQALCFECMAAARAYRQCTVVCLENTFPPELANLVAGYLE